MKRCRMISLFLALILIVSAVLPALAVTVICQKGDTGDTVKAVQTRLKELGYLKKWILGRFDDKTEKAVAAFQRAHGLLATGIVDQQTYDLLFSEDAQGPTYYMEVEVEEGAYAPTGSLFMYAAPAAKNSVSAAWETDWNTNEYAYIRETGFQGVASSPFSTFAADVDTASYAQLRRLILSGERVPADAVRIEEMLNYFHYDYAQPKAGDPFGVTMELAKCPWNADTLLLQVGLQAKAVAEDDRPAHNLVFLIDVSGSMFGEDRLDLVKRAFLMLLDELKPTDTVSIVTYASRDEVVLSGVPAADKVRIMEAISGLEAGGSTNSAAGIQTAYALAEQYAVEGGVNRVLMATDGDFNVGSSSEGDLARLIMEKKEKGVRLTMLGVGYGNYKDNKLETLADYGDGNYYYLDSIFEARRALVSEAGGTLVEVAKDVKLQLDFNPARVKGYRLIGYEDRLLAPEDFADDTKDGGEIGSGHRVTALYEIVPVGSAFDVGAPESKYAQPAAGENAGEWLTLNIRAKKPDADKSELWSYPLDAEPAEALSDNMKFAAAVAEAGMLLRDSEFKGDSTYSAALALARDCGSVTGDPYKEEFVYMLTLLERQAALK